MEKDVKQNRRKRVEYIQGTNKTMHTCYANQETGSK